MCRTLEISRSGYYGWMKNVPSREERDSKREKLVEKVRQIHEESRRNYGSPRILRVLRNEGIKCGKHRLEKLMHEEGIYGKLNFRRTLTAEKPLK
jgi:putative transposase